MNVLIVDDQPRIAQVTAVAVRTLGCRSFTAATTKEADRLLETQKIDALFLDVNLAGESGWIFLSKILARPEAPPVVMFSAMSKEEVVHDAIERGAFDCLVKPYSLNDLRKQIDRLHQHLQQRGNSTMNADETN